MKATGIVRRIDDLGRVVIPKEIRRTMRIREGDPLEIYTSREGEVIFKKYSLLGGVEDFAAELCETMSRSTGSVCAVTDRDTVIAVAGGSKRELMGKRITPELEQIMESRKIYQYTGEGQPLQVTEGIDSLLTTVAAPILAEGDLLGLVLFISSDPAAVTGDTEYKLAQTIAKNAPIAVRACKKAINDGLQTDIDQAVVIEEKLFGSCFQTADQIEGMGAFLEKRKHEPYQNK